METDAAITEAGRQRDLAYLRRLGQYENEARADALKEWLALPLGERLRRNALYHTGDFGSPRREPEEPERFYERAKRLGLYRP